MKSILFTMSLALLFTFQVKAQVYNGTVFFNSQADVTAFGTYTEITEHLFIIGADITDLSNLNSIKSVGGDLQIFTNSMLTNLDDLSNLDSLGGNLNITGNSKLMDVDGLSSIDSVRGYVWITGNDMLTNVDGFSSLVSIGDFLIISANGKLMDVDGLSGLNTVVGDLNIFSNNMLTNVDGFSSLNSVGGIFDINTNGMLANVDGLMSLDSVGVSFGLSQNPMLTNINGLSSLMSIGNFLYIKDNAMLANIDSLASLKSVGAFIVVEDNLILTDVNGLSSLISLGNYLSIQNNPALNTLQSYCGLFNLLSTTWNEGYFVSGNGIDPSRVDIVDPEGPCFVVGEGSQPSITGRDTSICMGDSIDLSTLVTGDVINTLEYGIMYGTYHPDSNMVSPLTTTTYYVRDSSESTMLWDTAQITVMVNPQPSIAGRDTTICAGESVDLSILINGVAINTLEYGKVYGTYHPDSNMVSPLTTTTYYVIDSSASTTCADTAQITVTVLSPMECLMEFYSANKLNFDDPCDCDQALIINGQEGSRYYFRDTLVIEAPSGLMITYDAMGSSNFYDETGFPMVNGTAISETSPGVYKVVFYKLNGVAAVGYVMVNGQPEQVQIDPDALEVCSVAEHCPELVPTMGQWGLLICGLLFFIVGVVGIRVKEPIIVG